jgi:hypothetical protein
MIKREREREKRRQRRPMFTPVTTLYEERRRERQPFIHYYY